jgi:general secretion pathway protein G
MPGLRKTATCVVGMTLLELIIAIAILIVLASAALPLFHATIQRQREAELRRDLREIRDAIDNYKDDADKGLIRVQVDTEGYPPDLDTLVKGVQVGGNGNSGTATGETVRFLRRIPKDPTPGDTSPNLPFTVSTTQPPSFLNTLGLAGLVPATSVNPTVNWSKEPSYTYSCSLQGDGSYLCTTSGGPGQPPFTFVPTTLGSVCPSTVPPSIIYVSVSGGNTPTVTSCQQ